MHDGVPQHDPTVLGKLLLVVLVLMGMAGRLLSMTPRGQGRRRREESVATAVTASRRGHGMAPDAGSRARVGRG